MNTLEDKVRAVEDSPVDKLADVDIEDVYEQMDHLLERRPSPLDLYDRWEAQNWRVAELDFSEDAQHWQTLMPGIQMELLRIFTEFFIGEQAVTDTLSPLLIAAPTEDDRIFLSTQVVDEARHTVFFKRFFEDVLGLSGGLTDAFAQLRGDTVEGFKKIFDEDLVEATDRCRLDPGDRVAWVRGLTIYHLVIEGMLALTGQKFLLRVFRNLGMMPGFRAGFTAVARDESRHVNYGVTAIRNQIKREASMADEAADAVFGILEAAVKTIEPADRPYAGEEIEHPNELPPPMRINPREVYNFSVFSLTKRLRVAGLDPGVTKEVEERALGYYEDQIDHFEKTFDREHGIRLYDRGEVDLFYPEVTFQSA
jgi:ribonucleoside-diphosphate reductase beta chain